MTVFITALKAIGLTIAIADSFSIVSVLLYLVIASLWQLSHDPMFGQIEESSDGDIDTFMRETVITDQVFRFLCFPIAWTVGAVMYAARPLTSKKKRERS